MSTDDDVIDEPSEAVREAVAELHRAISKLVAAKFGCALDTLAQTDFGAALQTGQALITFAGFWPDFTLRLTLCTAGKPPLALLEVSQPREVLPKERMS